jgi:endonuclease/exonuclease/phosphatase family metal-dependent hydrolase
MKLRIASFNLENLFSRVRVFNFEDHTKVSALLAKIEELDGLLKQSSYGPADRKQILALEKYLRPYITIRVDMGKLFTGLGAPAKVVAAGKSDWSGEIEFKRAEVNEMARESTIRTIKAVKADVMCVVEVENRLMLEEFNRKGLGTGAKGRFDEAMCIDGNDKRGIDVGLLSRFPIRSVRPHIYDGTTKSRTFSRDCPEMDLDLGNGRVLHVLSNHFVSKMNGDKPESKARRKRQAQAVADILSGYDLDNDLVVVAGDLNDTPDSAPLAPLLRLPGLHDVLELQFGADMSQRWTYKYKNELNQIDYLLVSKPLKEAFVAAGIERRGIHGIQSVTGEAPFPSVTSWTTAASDHGAVWADFAL